MRRGRLGSRKAELMHAIEWLSGQTLGAPKRSISHKNLYWTWHSVGFYFAIYLLMVGNIRCHQGSDEEKWSYMIRLGVGKWLFCTDFILLFLSYKNTQSGLNKHIESILIFVMYYNSRYQLQKAVKTTRSHDSFTFIMEIPIVEKTIYKLKRGSEYYSCVLPTFDMVLHHNHIP